MSARELEDFIGLIEKAESSVSYLTDIYKNTKVSPLSEVTHSPRVVPRLSFPPSVSPSSYLRSTSKSLALSTNKPLINDSSQSPPKVASPLHSSQPILRSQQTLSKAGSPLRHPPFGRVIARDLSPAITPESSPITTRRKKTTVVAKKKKPASSSRSSTPSPPRSAPPIPVPAPKLAPRKKTKKPPPVNSKTVNLKNYAKSLQLIGISVSPETVTASADEDVIDKISPPPRLVTRLKERTQSLSDIKRALEPGVPEVPLDKFKDIKRDLCNAVFEEWYFKKLSVEAELKSKAQEERSKRGLEAEDKREKADDNFKKWLQSKRELRSNNSHAKAAVVPSECDEGCAKDEEVKLRREKEWLERKNKELRERRRVERCAQKEMSETEKVKRESKQRENAKYFEEWSKVWSKKMKERRLKEKERRLKESEEMNERKEVAELSFNAWLAKKKKKPQGRQCASPAPVFQEAPPKESPKKSDERSLRSQEAFSKWLESLELRDEVRTADEEFQLREMWKPPWYPPGH